MTEAPIAAGILSLFAIPGENYAIPLASGNLLICSLITLSKIQMIFHNFI